MNPPRSIMKTMLALVVVFASATPVFAEAAQAADERATLHVLNRVAFGPRAGDLERLSRMGIDAWLDEQLHPERLALPDSLTARLATLDTQNKPIADLIAEFRADRKAVQEAKRAEAAAGSNASPSERKADAVAMRQADYRRFNVQSGEARLARAIESPRQLEEVMTDFWFNHFNVFIGKGLDRVLVANYERDAIRPHALGNFRDLLGATARHPAMLFYLDNWLSTSPDFEPRGALAVGQKAKAAGLNENYARELMELHTLGVENEGKPGGYTQRDVTELARILTGWTFDPRPASRNAGQFVFDARRHDNGVKIWLGTTITPDGQAEGEHALDVLASHPATAHHIGYQLAQYFVADNPPAALVDRLAARFLATRGDIRAVLKALFDSAEFRDPKFAATKFKTPYQYVVSAARASGVTVVNVRPLLAVLAQLGMPLYGCQTPDGYKNTEDAWLNPEGMTRRINFATALATGRLPIGRADADAPLLAASAMTPAPMSPNPTPAVAPTTLRSVPVSVDALIATLGPGIGARTRTAVGEAEPDLAAALVLGSPDFMRR